MVGKEIKINRDSKGRFAKKIPWYLIIVLFALAGLLALLNEAVKFGATHDTQSPIKEVRAPVVFQEVFPQRAEPEWISPVVEVIEQSDIEVETEVDQLILELWGERYFLLARSIFKCESGLRADAVNWGSRDIGIAQINWTTWENPVKERFGYTLVDMFDPAKNLEVAHWIWDRDGDGVGSFEPWTVYQNGSFKGCVE